MVPQSPNSAPKSQFYPFGDVTARRVPFILALICTGSLLDPSQSVWGVSASQPPQTLVEDCSQAALASVFSWYLEL